LINYMIKKYICKKNRTYNNILQIVNIYFKWFKSLQKLIKYLTIYWIWVDYTISIIIEKLDSYGFTKKKSKQVFHSNEHKHVEKKILLKNYFHLKDNKNYVEGICI
jgi:hypothetical protein